MESPDTTQANETHQGSQTMDVTKLLIMVVLHFMSMFFLMYAMIASLDHFYININNFYMAGLMTAPMIIFEAFLMGSMYDNKKLLRIIAGSGVVILAVLFFFIREQVAITDTRFLRSMIPHHSSAILMCEKAAISDPEIRELCTDIIQTQQEEIAIMERKLAELE